MSNQKQSGKITGIIIAIALALAVGGFAVYWFMFKDSPGSIVLTSEEQQTHNMLVAAGADKTLANFMIASGKQVTAETPYVMTSIEDGRTTATIKLDGKGNMHMTSEDADFITYEGKTYFKDGDTWYIYPSVINQSDVTPGTFDFSDYATEGGSDTSDGDKIKFEYIGAEKMGDYNVHHYRIFDEDDSQSYTDVWFDQSNYRLYRMATSPEEDGSRTDFTISYEAVVITPPANAVEFEFDF